MDHLDFASPWLSALYEGTTQNRVLAQPLHSTLQTQQTADGRVVQSPVQLVPQAINKKIQVPCKKIFLKKVQEILNKCKWQKTNMGASIVYWLRAVDS